MYRSQKVAALPRVGGRPRIICGLQSTHSGPDSDRLVAEGMVPSLLSDDVFVGLQPPSAASRAPWGDHVRGV
jgi:hypothetical protein